MPKRRQRRGRCRRQRWIQHIPPTTHFIPQKTIDQTNTIIELTLDEVETLRLVDLENLTQEQAATQMGVSRKTLWLDLQKARRKIAHALVHGHQIRILISAHNTIINDGGETTICPTEIKSDHRG